MNNAVYLTNLERTQELNDRIFKRQYPSQYLQSVLRPRSVPTRYVDMPRTVKNEVVENIEGAIPLANVTPNGVFLAGGQLPFEGYMSVVDVERRLQNKVYSYKKDNVLTTFIPDSQSMMYEYSQPVGANIQTHPRLFSEFISHEREMNLHGIGGEWFNNPTRQQVKNIGIPEK
jgi:hypothetical protein